MDDKQMFAKLLDLRSPWSVQRVVMDEAGEAFHIYVEHAVKEAAPCPVCATVVAFYDHAPECIFRHLDTCRMRTFIHVRSLRVQCPRHGLQELNPHLGHSGALMTFAFENFVIRLASECSIDATARICGLI